MPIYVYGMNHSSAPLEVRERMAFPEDGLAEAVGRLVAIGPIKEGLILSTCNRTEIVVHAAADATGALKGFLVDERRAASDELDRHCYLRADGEAVRHLFRVASSLDSMILGEAQILGQVKEAYSAAVRGRGIGTVLDALMQRSFAVAKKVRTETGVSRFPVSIAHAAVSLARDIFGELRDRVGLIVGAGKMGRLAAQHLMAAGVRTVVVVNRSGERAAELARELAGVAADWDRRFDQMERADIVIASTAAPHAVIGYDEVLRVSRARRGRPLFFIDIAVPRDVDPRVNEIDNVYLYDVDDLQGVVQANLEERRREAETAGAIVEREVTAYLGWLRSLDVGPLIVDLREHVHNVGAHELARFRSRLGALTPQQQKTVEEMTEALVNKFLHHPIQAMKRAAANGGGDRLTFLREVFGLSVGEGRSERLPAAASAEDHEAAPDHPDGGGAERKLGTVEARPGVGDDSR